MQAITRWETLRELNAAADSLSTTSQLWASPVTVLARAGLGSPERTANMQQLTGAASVELRQMAAYLWDQEICAGEKSK